MSAPETLDGGPVWYRCPRPMVLGEAPIYRASDATLHWVDCLASPPELHILAVDPDSGDPAPGAKARVLTLADSVTVQFFRQGRPGYICAYYQGVAFLNETTGALEVLHEIIPTADRGIRRFNDGGVDARGRFWLAEIDVKAMAYGPNKLPESYGEPIGRLWRYDPDNSLHLMDTGVICGNGLAWSPDNKTMYFNDSVAMKVYKYDFDVESGNIANRTLFIDRRPTFGEPDGMVVDTDGNLWIAAFASNRVLVYDSQGNHLRDVMLPAFNPTCTTWGGRNWDIMYVASGTERLGRAGPEDEGGHMFKFRVPAGIKGMPKYEFGG